MPAVDLTVGAIVLPRRLDAYLAEVLGEAVSRASVKRALDAGTLTLNGKIAKPSSHVKTGDVVRGVVADSTAGALPSGEAIPLSILYEDEALVVVDKAAGMVVHPGAGNRAGTLVNALLGRGEPLADVGDPSRPGIVHRLDKDTSGIILVAKTDAAHRRLQEQFAARSLSKTYLALVKGSVQFDQGSVQAPIGRDSRVRERMAVRPAGTPGAREAETRYRVLERFRYATLLSVKPLTGRTHQIRVHLAHAGHPVVGDRIYAARSPRTRLALHASAIEFSHPTTGEMIKFESPAPPEFEAVVEAARRGQSLI
jgi:23S rRNA pseudouridine1911/1915/1917 synthase